MKIFELMSLVDYSAMMHHCLDLRNSEYKFKSYSNILLGLRTI